MRQVAGSDSASRTICGAASGLIGHNPRRLPDAADSCDAFTNLLTMASVETFLAGTCAPPGIGDVLAALDVDDDHEDEQGLFRRGVVVVMMLERLRLSADEQSALTVQ
ncbi:hypothetical protein GCM10010411_76830 [Actinomadura fulvescens]|uniref:Uncharacterized protein n=1 Tax=Actinomadura fulvescens TaxID=46160 RepID=A0ABN3QJY4_9ACTN